MKRSFLLAALLLLPLAITAATILGYSEKIPVETEAARVERHVKIAERRAQKALLIAHRGAATMALENTLEACALAMDYGADGCEVDVRRTKDGVLVLFHDDMLDRLTDGFGQLEELSYSELLSLRSQRGHDAVRTRPPTFAALLTLARQRAMLLFLDTKTTGLDDDIAKMLDETDMWDHVIALNSATAPKLRVHPKLKPLPGKAGIYENRLDLDPDAVKTALAKPGQFLMLEDPRVAARELKRPAFQPVPLPREVFASWTLLSKNVKRSSLDELLSTLNKQSDGARDVETIFERARAAQQLGCLGKRNSRVVEALENAVRHASLHTNWLYCGLDAHTAARALGRLDSQKSVPMLIDVFRRTHTDAARFRNPEWTKSPLSWVDWRKMSIVPLLGELGGEMSKQFLLDYVNRPESEVRAWSIPQFEEATRALLRYRLTRQELLALLRSRNPAVRGTAILECLDQGDRQRTAALREAAPWALELPRVARRS